ncbi:hypothetical protein ACJIZ3_014448 [Penstemon smallii]|uniref:JmjC domain-containing protein n=1 Tax=Penstemon smallii TaxID=265156 RepID=A0ABD3RUH3_9LAMI
MCRYPTIDEASFAEACPICRNICNCGKCLRSKTVVKELLIPELELSTEDKIYYSKYKIKVLLPSLEKFVIEDKMEREEEARTQVLQKYPLSTFKARNNTSVMDIHRSCLNCLYKLCVTCCREVRNGFQLGNGGYYRRVVDGNFNTEVGSSSAAYRCPPEEWKLMKNGGILCPPKVMGGCAQGILELYSIYPDNQVPELLVKVEAITKSDKLTDGKKVSEGSCSCLRFDHESNVGIEKSRKAASREECSGNYLYSPQAVDIKKTDLKHFQWHLSNGDPVIVSNVLDGALGLSWEPTVMERAFRVSGKNELNVSDVHVINCVDWSEEKINVHKFFEGYSKGLFDSQGSPKILKLETWPQSVSFDKQLPRHFAELIRCLPFRHYTHPVMGCLNIAAKLPKMCTQDLGPKMCVSYGPYGVEQGSDCYSVTKLHYAASDRVNILMHSASITHTPEQLSMIAKLKKRHVTQDPFLGNNEIAYRHVKKIEENKGKSPMSVNRLDHFEDLDGGSIWDIFRRQDVPKLEEYLRNHSEEFGRVFPLHQMVHPVHEQKFYLTEEHKRKLKEEYGIEPWTFVQRIGDAVFIPVGCPYQIRNLKSCINVVVDFVSSENAAMCIHLSGYRSLPHNHVFKELQVKKMILQELFQAVEDLEKDTL